MKRMKLRCEFVIFGVCRMKNLQFFFGEGEW